MPTGVWEIKCSLLNSREKLIVAPAEPFGHDWEGVVEGWVS